MCTEILVTNSTENDTNSVVLRSVCTLCVCVCERESACVREWCESVSVCVGVSEGVSERVRLGSGLGMHILRCGSFILISQTCQIFPH